ncbi:MAG: ABC transporter substrate-binding protein [Phycisphaerales bacterium]
MRVVSLLPSATEILCELGGRDLLVGRSHECDFPDGLGELPALTGQKTAYAPESGVSAADVDAAVREHLSAGGASDDPERSLYTLDADALAELEPDVILTQDVCDVCSIALPEVERAARVVAERTGRAPDVIALNPTTVEGVLDDLLRVGRAVGLAGEAKHAVVRLQARLVGAQEFVNEYAEGPVVGFLEWTDPLYIAGHWTVQLIERAGGRHPLNPTTHGDDDGAAAGLQQSFRKAGKSVAVPGEVFARTNPEFLFVAPCGLTLEQATRETLELQAQPWFADLPAVRAGRVFAIDGSAMFNRPGPRLVEAFEFLVATMNDRPGLVPAEFPFERVV